MKKVRKFCFSNQEEKIFNTLLAGMDKTPQAEIMRRTYSHSNISTLVHVVSVTKLSFLINRRLGLHCSEPELVRGAFLHDFYLYDWHEGGFAGRLHGIHHPYVAWNNARQFYDLTDRECNIIASHMWPLNFLTWPRYREAVIVCIADKICSIYETCHKKPFI